MNHRWDGGCGVKSRSAMRDPVDARTDGHSLKLPALKVVIPQFRFIIQVLHPDLRIGWTREDLPPSEPGWEV